MHTPKIVFFDLDNTLYLTGQERIPESALYALEALQRQGITTAIATGRSIVSLPEAVKPLIGKGIDIIVAINGQYVQYQGKEIAAFPLDAVQVSDLSAQLRARGIAHGFVADSAITVVGANPYLETAMADVRVAYAEADTPPHDLPAYQMLAFVPAEKDAEIAALLPEDWHTVRWHELGTDILHRQGSKARGIQAALKERDIRMSEAMAFGDGLNDVEMITSVGCGVAMADGVPALKILAAEICPPAAEDGIYRFLADRGIIPADARFEPDEAA